MFWAPLAIFALLAGSSQTSASKPSSATAGARATQPSPTLAPVVASLAGQDQAAEKELLEMINKRRAQAGLATLRLEPSLSEAARTHARLMVASGQLEHQFAGEPALL